MASTRLKTLTGASFAGAAAACALAVAPAQADVGSSYPYSASGSRKPTSRLIGSADFNADGHADLLLLGGGSMATAPGDGRAASARSLPGPERVDDAAIADFNGDGIPDLVSAAKASGAIEVTVSLNLGDGRFARTAEACCRPTGATSPISRPAISTAMETPTSPSAAPTRSPTCAGTPAPCCFPSRPPFPPPMERR